MGYTLFNILLFVTYKSTYPCTCWKSRSHKVRNHSVCLRYLCCTCIGNTFSHGIASCHIHVVHLHTYYAGVSQDILSPITVKSSISPAADSVHGWVPLGGRPDERLKHFQFTLCVDTSTKVRCCPGESLDFLWSAPLWRSQQCSIYRHRHFRAGRVCPLAAWSTGKWPINVVPPAGIRVLDVRRPPAAYRQHHLSLDAAIYSQVCMMFLIGAL